ncbi:MAG: hypothetical protein ACI8RD_004981 [Bacillariaceae sp.]|jgi:hypothetical protein
MKNFVLLFFLFSLLVLLQEIKICSSASTSTSSIGSIDKNKLIVKTECLATDEDYRSFHCLAAPEEYIRVPTCVDENENCLNWANNGECQKNQQFMLVDCRKSCKSCIDLHGGSSSNAVLGSGEGVQQIAIKEETRQKILKRLYETQEYLHREAKRNIQTMKRCVNKHSECTHWWSIGECNTNPGFMHTECSPACQTCQKIVQ